jgi:hypothetical protein
MEHSFVFPPIEDSRYDDFGYPLSAQEILSLLAAHSKIVLQDKSGVEVHVKSAKGISIYVPALKSSDEITLLKNGLLCEDLNNGRFCYRAYRRGDQLQLRYSDGHTIAYSGELTKTSQAG